MTGTAEDLSAVVIAFHRPASLRELLESLRPIEAVVVNVTDDVDVAAVAKTCRARVVACPANVGFAAAVNLGASMARTTLVATMNDDVLITGADVVALARNLAHADVAAPALVTSTGEVEPSAAAIPTPGRLLLEWVILPDHPPSWMPASWRGLARKWTAPTGPERVDAVAATVLVARRQLLDEVPMPEDYFLYWEESDWFFQLRRAGMRIVLDPRVRAIHAGGRDDVRPDKSRLLARNAVRCVRRTQGRAHAALSWPIVVLWNVRLLLVDLVRSRGSARVEARLAGLAAAVGAWREVRR
jgi:GT2 family glycosyltransferase